VSGSHLIRMGLPNRAYQLDQACVIVTDPAQDVIGVRALIVEPSHPGEHQASRLIRALWAQFPGKQWRVPALCPEAYGGFFEKLGFTRQALNQVQMRFDLSVVPE